VTTPSCIVTTPSLYYGHPHLYCDHPLLYVKRSTGHTHTHTTAEHTTAEETTHTNTERETAQRRLIVEVVVAPLKMVVVREHGSDSAVYYGNRAVESDSHQSNRVAYFSDRLSSLRVE